MARNLGIQSPYVVIIRILTVLIFLVLANHWHLAFHYVDDLHRNDAHHRVISLATFLGEGVPNAADANEQSISSSPDAAVVSETSQKQLVDDEAYITSPICGLCYRGEGGSTAHPVYCHTTLERWMSKNASLTLADATKDLVRAHTNCQYCLSERCYGYYSHNAKSTSIKSTAEKSNDQHSFKYWRFDTAAPKFTNPTTITFNSIPSSLRIPPSRFHDIGKYFQEKYWERHNNATSNSRGMDFLMEYNPGIVVLPDKLKKRLPREAAYLLSMRVTQANNCFAPEIYEAIPLDVRNAVYWTSVNHLGLALVDANYNILPGYEVVIEVDAQLDLKRVSKQGTSDFSPTFMDYRIFLLNNEVYLHANGDTTTVTKLKINAKGFNVDQNEPEDTVIDPNYQKYRNVKLKNLYGGDMLEVTVEHMPNTIWSGGIFGKNYALFGVPNTTHPTSQDSIYAELDIYPKHRTHQVVLDEYDLISLQQVFEFIWKPGTHKRRNFACDKMNQRKMKTIGNITENTDAPPPSFPNVDSFWYPGEQAPFKETLHGGACCVEFTKEQLNTGDIAGNHAESLLVGIAHTKVPWRNWYTKASKEKKDRLPHTHYVSMFYAFDSYPPFQIRARSGFFCLGFVPETKDGALPKSEGGRHNPHNVLTRNRKLSQNNVIFDCPQISFVSSFTQKANDGSSVVIGYGLNDCTGRLVEVTKEEVVRLLFPPLDMVVE